MTDLAVDVEVDSLVAVLDELLVVPERAINENDRTSRLLQIHTYDMVCYKTSEQHKTINSAL